ncbi:MAG: protein O-mannosyl-transferase [Pyrinomonadaceae bacterium]|nr:protein O-mannosyl-transferase [Pyrinomonadaceae bacterium]
MRSYPSLKHDLWLAAFSVALFLPLIGGGFVHDDFVWLYNVAYRPHTYGLTHPIQDFYTPVTWLSFKLDWALWGFQAFPIAFENLLLHVGNTLLLYRLAWRLWGSRAAAWWAAFGFALFYMANSWAVMWISARTHLLATLFCLAAMLAAARYAAGRRRKLSSAIAIIACCALAMLSKEIGVASVAAVVIVLGYAGGWRRARDVWAADGLLIAALLAVLCGYLALRAWAGAVSVSSHEGWYQYAFEPGVFLSNLREYLSRTFLLAAIVAGAITLSQYLRGVRPRMKNIVTRREVAFSAALFAATIAPVILIRGRSGLYTYLPGVGAALLLGAAARALYECAPVAARRAHTWLSLSPIVIVAAALCVATIGQSWKWRTMAKTNTAVLAQMTQQELQPGRGARIVLRYATRDESNRFPDGFATWGFPFAVKLLYQEPDLNGEIATEAATVEANGGSREVVFQYSVEDGHPRVSKRE